MCVVSLRLRIRSREPVDEGAVGEGVPDVAAPRIVELKLRHVLEVPPDAPLFPDALALPLAGEFVDLLQDVAVGIVDLPRKRD